ncbi:hypothetical protein FC770_02175 [Nocardioides jishulii]|uniref:Uncharacterized protein n=1 Tax=Nocardioides jishulii TaxID=2575440 RepID=A0A4U2YRG4_9ACTN|nr:hypothetical protein FCL41_00535 [Nocardioides jishulii]TKI64007.1 hypothetical protein FC770_02175 [Nocardioides jishulii]
MVRTLLDGRNVLVTDRSFEDPERRDLVAEAFRRTLPGLVVDQVTMGGGAPPAEPAPNPHPGIVIDADVYGDAEWSSHERIVVTADAPREVLVAALEKAAYRMTFVGDNGRVYEDVVDAEMEDVYTPDWFSEVKVDERGDAGFYIDCNGAIEDPMAARFKEILVEELVRAGIERAHVRVP